MNVVNQELLILLFLALMVVATIAVGFWTPRIYRKFPDAAGAKWLAGNGWSHLLGFIVFVLMGPVALLAYFWPASLVLGLVFLALAARRLGLHSHADREIAGVLVLCGVIWLAFAGHEAQFLASIRDAKRGVGGFIAVDLLLTAPLLYFTSVVGLALGTDKWFKRENE
jgi:hypothetical protein